MSQPDLNTSLDTHVWEFLDYVRSVFARKTDGLDAAGLAQPLPPTDMTLGGMLSHLAYVEDYWFSHRFAGEPEGAPWEGVDWETDNDFDWHWAADIAPDRLRDEWRAAVERSRRVVADAAWEQPCALPGKSGHTPDLGWVVLHMIEEYARHNGHADLLRESVDGTVG